MKRIAIVNSKRLLEVLNDFNKTHKYYFLVITKSGKWDFVYDNFDRPMDQYSIGGGKIDAMFDYLCSLGFSHHPDDELWIEVLTQIKELAWDYYYDSEYKI